MKALHKALLTSLLVALSAIPFLKAEPVVEGEIADPLFTQAELDQMLAPIALYPDVLLSQVLMAATYPLEVVEASRWSRDNPDLKGDEAVASAKDQPWDQSVITLIGFPEVIQLMDENLSWTRRLGDAFLLQEEQVMETIQNLRRVALDKGQLEDMEHLVVEEEEDAIIIEPSDVRVVYVPYYNTRYVYGNWWWADYPPYCWDPWPGYYSSVGFHWSSGFHVSTSFYFSNCYWPRRRVVITKHPRYYHDDHHNRPHHKYYRDAPEWRHDPIHRRGVRYSNERLNERHERYSSSGITRNRVPDHSSGMRHDIGRDSSKPIVADRTRSYNLTRTKPDGPQPGPVISGSRSREDKVERPPTVARRSADLKRTERANRLARSSEGRRVVREAQIRQQKQVTNPEPVNRSNERVSRPNSNRSGDRSKVASSNRSGDRSKVASSNRSTSKPAPREARPPRQPSQSSSSSQSRSTESSNSRWSNNNSYAASRQSRQNRAESVRKAIRPHEH